LIPVNVNTLKVNDRVYVKSLDAYGILVSIKGNKKEGEVLIGSIKSVVKISDLFNNEVVKQEKKKVKISRNTYSSDFSSQINVIGQDSIEALENVKNFLDKAIVNNLEEVKIIHGVGAGILLKEIRNYLKTLKTVKEFRRGKYGEGESGVTVVTLK
jgi:DNA mismatch repair protein MutS2